MNVFRTLILFLTVFFICCTEYQTFDSVDPKSVPINFDTYQTNQTELRDSLESDGFEILQEKKRIKPFIKNTADNKSLKFDHRFLISEIYPDTLVFISGVRTFDSGLAYFFNQYSEIYIIRKQDLSILKKFKTKEKVNNTMILDGKIYFWYGDSNNMRMGSFDL